MYDFVKTQKENPGLINARVRAEELKQSDYLFIKTGIEEVDVEPSCIRLKMSEDEEYTTLVNEW